MKGKDFIIIAVFLAGLAFVYFTSRKETTIARDRAIDSLYNSHDVLVNFDSVYQARTKKLIDSVYRDIHRINSNLKASNIKADKLAKQNEELLNRYRDLDIKRPDF